MTRSHGPWLSFGLLCAIFAAGCGSSSSGKKNPPLETLTSPSGAIEVGLDQIHEVRLVPQNDAALLPIGVFAYPRVAGRVPQSIRILAASDIKVEGSACKDEICTIAYKQNSIGLSAPSLAYEILDSAGSTWAKGNLVGNVLMATPVKLESFTPTFGELQSLTFPIANSLGEPLTEAPTVIGAELVGSQLKSFTCSKEACLVEFTYNSFQVDPIINFHLQTTTVRSKRFQITPAPEQITYHDQTKAVYANPGTIRLTPGVDYNSSWKRPARQVHVSAFEGIESPQFTCFENACIASNVKLLETNNRSFTYTVGELNASLKAEGAKVQLEMREVAMMPLLQEALVDGGSETALTLEPGTGYTSTQGTLANTIQVYDRAAITQAGIAIHATQCDNKGSCTLKFNPFGLREPMNLEYSIGVDGYVSPKQTLKLVPKVGVVSSTFELAANSDPDATYELMIKPDVDYRSWDGSPAQSIQVGEALNLSFVQDFRCDADGICRALVKMIRADERIGTLQLVVQTATGKSTRVTRNVWLNEEKMLWLNPSQWMNHVSQKKNETEDTFTFSFRHKLDYVSIRPATAVKASVVSLKADSEVTIDQPSCDEATGVCTVSGSYTAKKGYFDLEVELSRARWSQLKTKIRIIRSDRADIVPNLVRFTAQRNDSMFDFVVERGEGKGYRGRIAKSMKIVESSKTTTVPCSAEGRCVYALKPVGLYPILSYSLVDEQGVESTPHTPAMEYPTLTATSHTYRVRSGDALVTIPLPVYSSAGVDLDVDASANLESFKIAKEGRRIQITMALKNGLKVGEKMDFVYRLKRNGISSNTATLTLEGWPELSMKDNTVIDAKEDADGSYTFEISYANDFNQLPIPIVYNYFFELSLKFPETDPVKDSYLHCDIVKFTCSGTFSLKDGVKANEVHPTLFLKPNSMNLPPRAFVKDSPFTVRLIPAKP